ncbi:glycosyltransferase family 4 protein [Mucilaginibacter sp. Bleaf8]|uniref:glycosyltransferase family 4 protein n=1 Tax=Mucilaginibacter sp. Bleaf8 TaxID=2834430 RepID=UPI001BCE2962|nr:glycosyltransferase family 4 protein [Mucilaginibacter sp. Bleaf8]MBS7566817.1 glycosyltransferase family 4 protein [Mucilaginibacter sp. Bleaf8]
MKIGICGPIFLPLLAKHLSSDSVIDIKGMGGTPVNHQITALLEKGYEVHVYSITPELEPGESREWHGDKLHVYVGCSRKRARHCCKDLFQQERRFLKNAIIKSKPDIVHAHWQYEWGWAALDSGIPTLLTCHDSPIEVLKSQTDLYRLIRLAMAAICLRKATHLTAVSPYTAKGLRRFTKLKAQVIPNFEPSSVFSLYDPAKKVSGEINVTMINNGFHKRKNVAKGIEAFIEFSKQYPTAQLNLYGTEHAIGQDAYQWCKENNVNEQNIHFHGEVPFSELMTALSKAHIFLHTSLEESCPMVLIEAMAMGIPVVAGEAAGGIPWMLEKGGGKLVDITDKDKIAAELIRLALPECNEQLAHEAREVAVQNFSTSVVIDQYLSAYKEVLSA